jgi:hypothetical protein
MFEIVTIFLLSYLLFLLMEFVIYFPAIIAGDMSAIHFWGMTLVVSCLASIFYIPVSFLVEGIIKTRTSLKNHVCIQILCLCPYVVVIRLYIYYLEGF